MSTSDQRRSYEGALQDAIDFRAMFPSITFSRWEFAGSVRRKIGVVNDVDHIIIPRFGNKPNGGLFGADVNLLCWRLDELVAAGEITKHAYGTTGPRWGDKLRGVDWRNLTHEVHMTTAESFGAALAIYTGPSDYSRSLVTGLLRNHRRNFEGQVWRCDPCPNATGGTRNPRCDKSCRECQGTQLKCIEPIAVPEEEEYFRLCGISWCEPERRS